MPRLARPFGRALVLVLCWHSFATRAWAEPPPRLTHDAENRRLTIELLSDGIAHIEIAPLELAAPATAAIPASAMVDERRRADWPISHGATANTVETKNIAFDVDPKTLAVTVRRPDGAVLLRLHPTVHVGRIAGIDVDAPEVRNIYGLGSQFIERGQTDGDWRGKIRTPGGLFGNALAPFDGGNVGNVQIPVLYALAHDGRAFAIFVDDVHPLTWDLRGPTWAIRRPGDGPFRFYVLAAPDLAQLRRQYLDLVGRSPVPPRKMFGLWVSEYGYEDWAEMEGELRGLRKAHIPVDGFVFDLLWFGGIAHESESSPMGHVAWDERRFPDPAAHLKRLRDDEGVGVMTIEESFVSARLPEFADLSRRGFLAHDCNSGQPIRLRAWWGKGGMLDWADEAAADYWHELKRRPLIDAGIAGHWIDLGEPEQFDPRACYGSPDGKDDRTHADVHNLYNFYWAASIARGYARSGGNRRPFSLSRSGTAGIQRFGAALWSGDIASRMSSLAAHLRVQRDMSMSGIDYYGADVGGFRRDRVDGDPGEMYSRWLAHAVLLDVPVRPHTSNLENRWETSPHGIGDVAGNRENVRDRYRLIPYLYSLAHLAWRQGDAIFAPLVLHFPRDPAVRPLAGQKMIGPGLMMASATGYGQSSVDVYLPAGRWADYRSGQWRTSRGEWVRGVPVRAGGVLRLPIFARAGAIIPEMFVDEQTQNALGRRADGTTRDDLIIRVFADPATTHFTLYEDDGWSTAYQRGAVRTTDISQGSNPRGTVVVIDAARGTFDGAKPTRACVVRLAHVGPKPARIRLNGRDLPQVERCEPGRPGWCPDGPNWTLVSTGPMRVTERKTIEFLSW